MGIGDIAPGHIRLDRLRTDPAAQQWMHQQTLQFRSKGDAAVRQVSQKQRLHPEPVTGQEQLPLVQIEQRKGKHPVKPGKTTRPPALPCGEDHLGITRRAEGETRLLQLAAQFAKIVDFAIEHDHCPAIAGVHRLGRTGQIDDRQPPVTQSYTVIGPHARTVRPAVG